MVRPGGCGRGANNPPPPPDYTVGMMQQFELNRQFMEGIMAQLPQQNHRAHNQQPTVVALHDGTRLNPTVFRNSDQPLDADDWLRNISHEMESTNVAPANLVTLASYHLKGSAAQWWSTHKRSQPDGEVITWDTFHSAFVPATFLTGSWTEKGKSSATSLRAT